MKLGENVYPPPASERIHKKHYFWEYPHLLTLGSGRGELVNLPSLVFLGWQAIPQFLLGLGSSNPTLPNRSELLPSFLRVLVGKGQDVWGSAAAIADHHGDRGLFSEIFQDDGNHVRAPFHHKAHEGHALPQPCNTYHIQVQTTVKAPSDPLLCPLKHVEDGNP